ncbi:MAG: hypothetical protein HC844_05425 [Tabrizicola sp.]|nr:hypothetical protein [Tabrizicola sp.]
MMPGFFRLGPLLGACLALSACVPESEAAEGSCGADALQHLVGQSETVLQAMRFGVTTRVIRPGMPVTMDYNPGRLNIRIGENGLIDRVSCG